MARDVLYTISLESNGDREDLPSCVKKFDEELQSLVSEGTVPTLKAAKAVADPDHDLLLEFRLVSDCNTPVEDTVAQIMAAMSTRLGFTIEDEVWIPESTEDLKFGFLSTSLLPA